MRSLKKWGVGGAALVALVFAAYWPALHGQFVWDDLLLVARNPLVTGEFTLRSIWFQTDFPLSLTALWAEWLVFGKNPAGYHVVNVALHAINVLLVWRLLAKLRIRGAWLGAALFAVHPVCAGSVAWISEIKNTLSLAFFLASFMLYVRADGGEGPGAKGQGLRAEGEEPGAKGQGLRARGEGGGAGSGARTFLSASPGSHDTEADKNVRAPASEDNVRAPASENNVRAPASEDNVRAPVGRRSLFYGLSLAAFLLALLSKTSTVVLPALLVCCAWWRHGRIRREDWLRTAPFFLLALGFGLLSVWFQQYGAIGALSVRHESFAGRLAGAGWALWFYLGKALAPVNLNVIYPRWDINVSSVVAYLPLALWGAMLGALALAVRASLNMAMSRRVGAPGLQRTGEKTQRRDAAATCSGALFALGCFTVALFPVLGFFDMYYFVISRVADHFEYLPIIALTALAGAAIGRAEIRSPKSEVRSPKSEVQGPTAEAGKKAETSNFEPSTPDTRHLPLPFVRLMIGITLVITCGVLTFHRARVFSTEAGLWADALSKNPASWSAHNNLACILAEKQDFAGAREHFEASLRLNPQNADAQANYGRLLAMEGNLPDATSHLALALKIKPQSVPARKTYASVLARQGKVKAAIGHLREALRLEPSTAGRIELAAMLKQTGEARGAIALLREAVSADPASVQALNNLAWMLATSAEASLRNGSEAVKFAGEACRLTANRDPMTLGTLAAAYAEAGRFPEAVSTAEKLDELAAASGNAQLTALNRQLLRLYRAGKAYHEGGR